jgi:hypothetical protein
MSLTKLSLGRNDEVKYKLFPPRESLVRDFPAREEEYRKAFFTV